VAHIKVDAERYTKINQSGGCVVDSKRSVNARKRHARILEEAGGMRDEFEESVVSVDMQGRHSKEFYSKTMMAVCQY